MLFFDEAKNLNLELKIASIEAKLFEFENPVKQKWCKNSKIETEKNSNSKSFLNISIFIKLLIAKFTRIFSGKKTIKRDLNSIYLHKIKRELIPLMIYGNKLQQLE